MTPTLRATTTMRASISSGSKRARRRIAGSGISATVRRPSLVFKRRRSRLYWSKARAFAFIDLAFWLAAESGLAWGPFVGATWNQVFDISLTGDQFVHRMLRDSRPQWSAEGVAFHAKKAH